MNKIGKWIERSINTFFAYDPQKSLEDNYFKQRKRQNEIWTYAEGKINEQQYTYAHEQKEKIKKML